jgi:hypothetical protein
MAIITKDSSVAHVLLGTIKEAAQLALAMHVQKARSNLRLKAPIVSPVQKGLTTPRPQALPHQPALPVQQGRTTRRLEAQPAPPVQQGRTTL